MGQRISFEVMNVNNLYLFSLNNINELEIPGDEIVGVNFIYDRKLESLYLTLFFNLINSFHLRVDV